MMKKVICNFAFIVILGCGQQKSEQKSVSYSDKLTSPNSGNIKKDTLISVQQSLTKEKQDEEYYQRESLSRFEKATYYKLTDTISADFNGDGNLDKAYYVNNKDNSGITIIHGITNEEVKIGFGKKFAQYTELDWVGYWGLVEVRETYETTFKQDGDVLGSKDVILQNPSIALGSEDSIAGLITFLNGKYIWIHQTC